MVDSTPYRGFSFRVEVGNFTSSGFSEVDGLGVDVDLEEYEEVTNPFFTQKVPKRYKTIPLTLRKGKSANADLINWVQLANGNGPTPNRAGPQAFGQTRNLNTTGAFKLDGFVHVVDPNSGKIVASWKFVRALPGRYGLTTLTAGQTNLVLETLELIHEGLQPYVSARQGQSP